MALPSPDTSGRRARVVASLLAKDLDIDVPEMVRCDTLGARRGGGIRYLSDDRVEGLSPVAAVAAPVAEPAA